MMKDTIKSLLGILLVALIGYAMGLGSNARRIRLLEERMLSRTDSVSSVEIVDLPKPVPKDSTIIHHVYVKVPVVPPRDDSVPAVNDSVMVQLPIERKVYQEDSLYRAVVSGWRPSLDTLTIFKTTTTVTVTKTERVQPKRWSFGVTAGPSVLMTPSGRVHAGVGVSAGVSYRF